MDAVSRIERTLTAALDMAGGPGGPHKVDIGICFRLT